MRFSAYERAWPGTSVNMESENANRKRHTSTTGFPPTVHDANDVSVVLELNCCSRGDRLQVKRQRVEN